jgi:hypothetical protein
MVHLLSFISHHSSFFFWELMRHGVDDVIHRPVGNPKRKV